MCRDRLPRASHRGSVSRLAGVFSRFENAKGKIVRTFSLVTAWRENDERFGHHGPIALAGMRRRGYLWARNALEAWWLAGSHRLRSGGQEDGCRHCT